MYKRCNIDPAIMTILRDYHAYHGDTNVRYCGTVHMAEGGMTYLMRFNNAQGVKYSSLDMVTHAADGLYATELWSAPRKRENEMIAFALEEGDEDGPVD